MDRTVDDKNLRYVQYTKTIRYVLYGSTQNSIRDRQAMNAAHGHQQYQNKFILNSYRAV